MYSNTQGVFSIVVMAMPKGDSFHLVADYCTVHQQLETLLVGNKRKKGWRETRYVRPKN